MGFNVLMGQSLLVFLLGLAFGHLFIFVKDELTVRYHRDLLETPIFLYTIEYTAPVSSKSIS